MSLSRWVRTTFTTLCWILAQGYTYFSNNLQYTVTGSIFQWKAKLKEATISTLQRKIPAVTWLAKAPDVAAAGGYSETRAAPFPGPLVPKYRESSTHSTRGPTTGSCSLLLQLFSRILQTYFLQEQLWMPFIPAVFRD